LRSEVTVVVTTTTLRWWETILRSDETNIAYFAERVELPGSVLFCAERPDAPEFNVALIYDVPAADAVATLQAIIGHFRARNRRPRVRLSPVSVPVDWPGRLRDAGFAETEERLVYFVVPDPVRLAEPPTVEVRRAVSAADGDRFSAIQVAAFDIPVAHRDWDRALVHRYLATGQHVFYLASLGGKVVGAARSVQRAEGVTGLAALTTLPDARGHGVGTSLLARMIADARAAGSTTIFGTIIPGSYAAGMYRRLGFVSLFATRTFTLVSDPATSPNYGAR
jgi:GNAT superfamily N-acetyltransferase